MINRILIIVVLLFISCDEEVVGAENVYGCTDETACNFNPSATIYVPNSCDYELDNCGICGGNNSSCSDCAGTPGGSATTDECGVCDADSSNDCIQDCEGAWGGVLEFDLCGVCGGNNSSCADFFSQYFTDEFANQIGFQGVEGNHTDCVWDRISSESIPIGFGVSGAYPNPFNPATSIDFQIPQDMQLGLRVVDQSYNNIRNIIENGTYISAGTHAVTWDGLDSVGNDAPAGYYRFVFTFINDLEDGQADIADSECYFNIQKEEFLGQHEDYIRGHVYDLAGNPVANTPIYPTYDIELIEDRPVTNIDLALATSDVVNLMIERSCGILVKNIYEFEALDAGVHSITWDARNQEELLVLDGAYEVKLELLSSGEEFSNTIFLRRHLDDYYAGCDDEFGCESIATTNEQGYFEFSQNCLAFGHSFTQTDEFGNEIGDVSVPRRLKLFADTGQGYGSTDFFDVHPEAGAEINIYIDNE